jgi:adenylate cyclase
VEANDPEQRGQFERLGFDVSDPDAADTLKLIRYLVEQGADREEIGEAVKTRSLGPLALELALRGPGERVPFPEAAARAGLEPEAAAALWRALGFPDPLVAGTSLWPSQVRALRVLAEMGSSQLGSDWGLQLARVIGGSTAQLAEAIVDAYRLRVEMPRRGGGEPYSEIVRDYARNAPAELSALGEAVAEILRAHVVAVSGSTWALDESRAAVTRERTVGFADLVDYARRARMLSPAELTAAVGQFESHASDVVSKAGGRVVKLIGDEAMFVVDEPATACHLALELMRVVQDDHALPTLRIGLAAGPVVTHHGDYFGDIVNLAARLVKIAEPGEILISAQIADSLPSQLQAEPVELPPVKGYGQPIAARRLLQAR